MKRLIIAAIATTLAVPAFAGANDAIDKAAKQKGVVKTASGMVYKSIRDGKQFKLFYGMSSTTAMDKHAGGVASYRASEGKTVEVPYRGPIEETVRDILGGVRSACTYVGAAALKELTKRTTFIRVQEQENRIFG